MSHIVAFSQSFLNLVDAVLQFILKNTIFSFRPLKFSFGGFNPCIESCHSLKALTFICLQSLAVPQQLVMLLIFLLHLFNPQRFVLFKLGNSCVPLLLCNLYPFSSGCKYLIFQLQSSCLLLSLNFTHLAFSLVHRTAQNHALIFVLSLWSEVDVLSIQLLNLVAIHTDRSFVICKIAHGIATFIFHTNLSERQLPQVFEKLKRFYLI